ncbi:hypothetical protein ES708_23167 [subsurface metagenome]
MPMASPHKITCGAARTKYSLNPIEAAAIGAENPTINETHPLRKPAKGWNNFERKIYSPPALGYAAPSSP